MCQNCPSTAETNSAPVTVGPMSFAVDGNGQVIRDAGAVQAALNRAGENIDLLFKELAMLEEKASPVLSQVPQSEGDKAQNAAREYIGNSPHTSQIERQNVQLELAIERVRYITSRIEA